MVSDGFRHVVSSMSLLWGSAVLSLWGLGPSAPTIGHLSVVPLHAMIATDPGPLFALPWIGLLGMGLADWIKGEDDSDDGDNEAEEGLTDGGDALFAEQDQELDDFDDIDDLGDGDGAEGFDDGFGGDDSGGPSVEPRLEELENEVENISTTVNAVRSENESMIDSITEVEENVRKLLDIYEMVTQGVNPFVDDVEEGEFDADSFGLFDASDGDTGDESDGEDLDEELAAGDDDGFFDDDFLGEVGGVTDEADTDDEAGSVEDATQEGPEGGDSQDGGAGKTFEELKSEYESDSTEWPEEEPVRAPGEASTGGGATSAGSDDRATSALPTQHQRDASAGHREVKPYLPSLPGGYVTEFVVLEWLGYLLDHADAAGALRAINYYETIGWIGSAAAEELRAVLEGFQQRNGDQPVRGGPQLTIDHHVRSLEYIGQLAGDEIETAEIEAWPMEGGRGL